MLFVGVRNSAEKARLLRHGTSSRSHLPAADLAYDCLRHRDFLERIKADHRLESMQESLYWRWLVATGRAHEAADHHCRVYAALVAKVLAQGYDSNRNPIAVSDDGIRLDGSHRAAIAVALGIHEVAVDVYSWRDSVAEWRTRHVRDEAHVKREAQEVYVGRSVANAGSGESLGRVVFIDADVPARLVAALGRRARPVVVVELPNGRLQRFHAAGVALR